MAVYSKNLGTLIERNNLEDLDVDEDTIKTDTQEDGGWAWTRLISLNIGTGGGLL
jgi:hypothetical protein